MWITVQKPLICRFLLLAHVFSLWLFLGETWLLSHRVSCIWVLPVGHWASTCLLLRTLGTEKDFFSQTSDDKVELACCTRGHGSRQELVWAEPWRLMRHRCVRVCGQVWYDWGSGEVEATDGCIVDFKRLRAVVRLYLMECGHQRSPWQGWECDQISTLPD